MTKAERETPEIVTSGRTSSSRRQRIAKGSGRPIQEVNRLVKQFEDMRKMMKAATAMKNPHEDDEADAPDASDGKTVINILNA